MHLSVQVLVAGLSGVGVAALVLTSTDALADATQDCRSGSPEMRVAGCTRLLAEARTARQRAIALDGRCTAHKDRFAYADAIADCNGAIRADDDYPYSYQSRGMAQAGLNNHAAAIADFTRAHIMRPNLAWPLINRAKSYTSLGNTAAAINDYEEALQRKPDSEEAKSNLAALRGGYSQIIDVASTLCGNAGCN